MDGPMSVFNPATHRQEEPVLAHLAPTPRQLVRPRAMHPAGNGDLIFRYLQRDPPRSLAFPAGSILVLPSDSAPLDIDPGIATPLQRSVMGLAMLSQVNIDYPNAEGADRDDLHYTGALTGLVRYGVLDWARQQPPRSGLRQTVNDTPETLPEDFLMSLQHQAHAGVPAVAKAAESVIGALNENLIDHFNYHFVEHLPALYPYTPGVEAGALGTPTHLAQHAVNAALAQPFGGRKLLAALFLKLMLNYMGTRIAATGRPSPADWQICTRALQVLNALAAGADTRLAGPAAGVAAELRRLTPADRIDLLGTFNKNTQRHLPVIFRRDQIDAPAATQAMAEAVFAQSKHATGPALAQQVAAVADLAHKTASLLFDPLAAGALGLDTELFQALATRTVGFKDGARALRLNNIAPDADYRRLTLLPLLDLAFRYHGWMHRHGHAAALKGRKWLQREHNWPPLVPLAEARPPVNAERTAAR